MKKKNKKSKITLLVILFVVTFIVVMAVLAIQFVDFDKLFSNTPNKPTPVPAPAPASIEEPATEPTEVPTATGDPAPAPEPVKQETPQYDGQNPNTNDQITGVITYAGASGNNLVIRVNIDQYLNGGVCNLALSQNGKAVYGISAPITDSASTATCEGFNIPLAEVPSGKYQIVINLTSERKSGTIEGTVSL